MKSQSSLWPRQAPGDILAAEVSLGVFTAWRWAESKPSGPEPGHAGVGKRSAIFAPRIPPFGSRSGPFPETAFS